MELFANHAHVFPSSYSKDGTVEALLRVMERAQIARAVCFAPFGALQGCEQANSWLAGELRRHPQLVGFGAIDFSRGDLEDQVEEIKALGFLGIKMHPQFQKFQVDGEPACRVYARAEQLGLFITFHTGIHWHRLKENHVLLFDEVAFRFPALKFSMEHVGGYSFFAEATGVLLNNREKQIYAGLTSVFDHEINSCWYLNPEKINDLLHLVGASKCIFGLDFPYNGYEKISEAIQCVQSLPIREEEKAGILGNNLALALGI